MQGNKNLNNMPSLYKLNALHEAILEDVRMRVAIIAQERHLDLVLIDHGGNIKGLDITDAVKASYRVQ